ncbi:hypothetical protein D3C77_635040 [compost metagenome]
MTVTFRKAMRKIKSINSQLGPKIDAGLIMKALIRITFKMEEKESKISFRK